MGNFSLFGEFENGLLEEYDIFSLDGSYGEGSFQIAKVNEHLQEYVSYNADPRKEVFSPWCFDPWHLELKDSEVSRYALLTDNKGEPFYQQAVAYMKANTAVNAVDKLLEYTKDTEKIQNWQKKYEDNQKSNDTKIEVLEDEKQKKIQSIESEAEENGTTVTIPEEPKNNPLKEIAKLRKKSTLSIVTWDKDVSEKKINTRNLPSGNRNRKGNLEIEKKYGGLVSDVLFREYLMMHFPNYIDQTSGETLDYQLEYILGGKATDQKNLKYVVNRLLLIREGMNYLYCLQDRELNSQAEGLAVTLTGFIGIPALTAATKHALLLGWAYGESLIDVRILLDGGKVPVLKGKSDWSLTIDNLGRITEILEEGAKDRGKGLTYQEYLRVLLNMGSVSSQKMRALDMVQAEMRAEQESSEFKAENCIVAIETNTIWNCKPVFLGLPGAVMGTSGGNTEILQKGSIAY
ncbi:MAG: DUF5702 domain-containing protein [Lachnospiraceae bacterium]|nr:DUF5702 domain-containing protein [Lachnospiraceae bacterium]